MENLSIFTDNQIEEVLKDTESHLVEARDLLDTVKVKIGSLSRRHVVLRNEWKRRNKGNQR